jgi:hypothetical protein
MGSAITFGNVQGGIPGDGKAVCDDRAEAKCAIRNAVASERVMAAVAWRGCVVVISSSSGRARRIAAGGRAPGQPREEPGELPDDLPGDGAGGGADSGPGGDNDIAL